MKLLLISDSKQKIFRRAERVQKLNRQIEELTQGITDAIIFGDYTARILKQDQKRRAVEEREQILQELQQL